MVKEETAEEQTSTEPEDLKPKKPSNRAPEGIRTFTVCRQHDETGISGEGVIIEGATFATGHTVIHWLTPSPRGSIAFFDAFDDFTRVTRRKVVMVYRYLRRKIRLMGQSLRDD